MSDILAVMGKYMDSMTTVAHYTNKICAVSPGPLLFESLGKVKGVRA